MGLKKMCRVKKTPDLWEHRIKKRKRTGPDALLHLEKNLR